MNITFCKKTKRPVLTVLAALVSFSGLFASETMTLEKVMKKMEQAEKNVESVSFSFEQVITYTLTNEKQANSGDVRFKKPDKILMRHNDPVEQIMAADGKRVMIYTPSYGQVIIDSWKRWASNSMVPSSLVSFVKDWDGLKKKYNFRYAGEKDGSYLLDLSPVKDDGWSMRLYVNKETFMPVAVDVAGENFKAETTTKDYKINPDLEKDAFKLKLPEGVEEIKLP